MKTASVLFVCTGNICRSPTARAVLEKRVAEAGLADAVAVDACGTIDYHAGEPPSPLALRVAARRGYDASAYRARQVRAEDFARFDLILAMDRGHLSWLSRLSPCRPGARVALFADYASDGKRHNDVPDPYDGDEADYEAMLDLIEDAMPGLLDRLKRDYL